MTRSLRLVGMATVVGMVLNGGMAKASKSAIKAASGSKTAGAQQTAQTTGPIEGTPPTTPVPMRPAEKVPNLKKQPTLFVVPYAHLDTQWRWDFQQVISEYLLKTMRVNFYLIQKYPDYVFNWTGSNRYRLMKEYYPDDYARVKQYVASGNWFPAGSSVEEGDVNLPSAESIFRQVLYGNEFFRKDFGVASEEYMLPDCFGFPASLPTILAHSGVLGFSTQKLNAAWQPAAKVGGPDSPEQTPEGIPFNVGLWVGPDGSTVMAALNPGDYNGRIRSDLSQPLTPGRGPIRGEKPVDWVKRIHLDGKVTGVFADYHYVGTGDIGGATDEESVKLLEAMVDKTKAVLPEPKGVEPGPEVRLGMGPVDVISAKADEMFRDIKPDMQTRMPRYQGDLELINHSAGSLTSEAYHKRWNRENEILADEAEKASVAAMWMGGRTYPEKRLTDAWTLLLAGQFHDTAAGTALPKGYEFAQNDDMIAANQFAGVLTSATEAVASQLFTRGFGVPVVVENPLNIAREDIVEAKVPFAGRQPNGVRVMDPDGHEEAAQIDPDGKVLFVARAPSVGYAVYKVRPAEVEDTASSTGLSVSMNGLENARYKVKLNTDGDVTSIFDKQLDKELLAAPMRLAISTDTPQQWPAWNMDFDQEQAAPRAYVSGPAKIRVVENGPVRVAVEVTRETEGSKFVQTVSLAAGDAGNRVVFHEAIDWRGKSSNLKAVFPLTASNPMATYNWEVGTVQRPTAFDRQFEVASHHWIDLTDASGKFGATILTDVKNGSDKRDDHTLRLTLIRTPGFPATRFRQGAYSDQLNQDWGHHEIVFGITGHAGNWRQAQTDWQAYRLSTPLVAFATTPHAGALGREFSLMTVRDPREAGSTPRIRVLALKKAEASDEVVVRMVELDGKPVSDVRVKFARPIVSAREVNGQEQPVGPAKVEDGALVTSFKGYEPRTFALRLGEAPAEVKPVRSQTVALKYDLAASSNDDTKTVGGFDPAGDALPAEMLPEKLMYSGVNFELAPAGTGKMDAVVARGQTIQLPEGRYNKVWVLAAAYDGDQKTEFRVGDQSVPVTVEDWGGFIGQWDTRLWKAAPDTVRKDWAVSAHHATWDVSDSGSQQWTPKYPEDYVGLRAGYVKRAGLAWYSDHHHTEAGLNEPYEYSYLFAYPMELRPGVRTLTLPANDKVRVLAVSVSEEEPTVKPVRPLYDTLQGAEVNPALEAAQ